MPNRSLTRQRQLPEIAWWKTAAFVLVCLVLALLGLWGAEKVPQTHPVVRDIIRGIGEAFLISGTISVIADQLVRRDISIFWLDAIGIKESVRSAGLTRIGLDFHDFPFKPYIQAAKEIDVCFMYGRTWLNNNLSDLKDFLAKKGQVLRFCLLDGDSDCAAGIAGSIGDTQEKLKGKIDESFDQLKRCADDLRKEEMLRGQLIIYKYRQTPRYTYYRFDDVVVLVPYNQGRGRELKIPVFEFRKLEGGVSKFLEKDFEEILTTEHSTLVYDSNESRSEAAPSG